MHTTPVSLLLLIRPPSIGVVDVNFAFGPVTQIISKKSYHNHRLFLQLTVAGQRGRPGLIAQRLVDQVVPLRAGHVITRPRNMAANSAQEMQTTSASAKM